MINPTPPQITHLPTPPKHGKSVPFSYPALSKILDQRGIAFEILYSLN
jgi:hypothetical protein